MIVNQYILHQRIEKQVYPHFVPILMTFSAHFNSDVQETPFFIQWKFELGQ